MKNKKIVIFLVVLLIATYVVGMLSNVKAATGTKILNIKMLRNSGYGYKINASGKKVWKIYEKGTNAEDTIYCLKGGPGFGAGDMSDDVFSSIGEATYTNYFNLKDLSNIPEIYKTALPQSSSDYNALLWILDNCYVAPKSNSATDIKQKAKESRTALLESALKASTSPDIDSIEQMELLTDDDIDAVQQVAIWYFTNPTGDYHVENILFAMNRVKNTDAAYLPMDETSGSREIFENGTLRADACGVLFDYLVKTAKQMSSNYDGEYKEVNPVAIAETTRTFEIQNDRYIVGPYKIEQVQDMPYTLDAYFTDENGNTISDLKLLNRNKQQVDSSTTIKDLIGEDFYISIPINTAPKTIRLTIKGSYTLTKSTYWSVDNPGSKDQPVVIIEKEYPTFEESISDNKPEKFDLALRKFITQVTTGNDTKTYNREPQVDTSPLKNKTDTTAKYNHDKTPIAVTKGSIVKYTIRVYNEGEVDGYATEVTDHLPTGLKFLPASESAVNSAYGWTNPSGDGKTIVTNYLADKIIRKFDGNTLDYKDLEIECEVIAEVKNKNQALKNIAEITEHKDDKGNTDKDKLDRDSQPGNVIINNYDKNQQDDDDYEDLVLPGEAMDLALRKFITRIKSGTEVKEYDRVPKVDITPLKGGTGTTAKYEHSKDPIVVSKGDIVRYTIRVYNEGKINGYATEITDYLPEGLKLAENSEINTKYGWTSKDGKKIQTTYLANRMLNHFDGTTLDYADIEIECEVIASIKRTNQTLKNIAEITAHKDEDGNTDKKDLDRDSEPDNVIIDNYDKNQQDDDDFEDLIIPGKSMDLALRKFITQVKSGTEVKKYDRAPVVDISPLVNGTGTTAIYKHSKTPVSVSTGDIVRYTIRIYNEGELDGYATEVTDYLPDGLKLAENSEINTKYGWSSDDGKKIKTTYLADKKINKFNGTTLEYVDLEIECEVIATVKNDNQLLKNIAEITEHKDEDGNIDKKDLDRDSQPDNVIIDNYDKNQQDDDDFEDLIIIGQHFDLSLRKFITEVKTGTKTKKYNREPQVDVTPLKNGSDTTAIYNHDKTPVNVSNGDIVTYTLRVYNEGELDGYVQTITDYLPPQLEFIVDDEINAKYGWQIVSQDGREIRTDITSPNTNNSANSSTIYANRTDSDDKVLLKAFDGTALDYIDVQVRCKVKDDVNMYEKITNIAEITDYTDKNGKDVIDRDNLKKSNVILPTDDTLPNYKDTEIERGDKYIPGQEDDDDFEKLIIRRFDLALKKFITGVNDKEITNRAPVFNITDKNEYVYKDDKAEPVEVANGNTVIYTLRIFNEGNMAGYAEEVKDDIPNGLEFLPENSVNTAFRWKMYKEDGTITEDVKEAKYIKTDYLSKANDIDNKNLLKAFDPEKMTMPDYRDLKVAFKVIEPNTSDRIIINTAEITDDADENGDEVEDSDSTPDNNEPDEDDQDTEKIKVKYFDLALKKWVTETIVTYNGKTTVTKTGHTGDENPEPPAKVEIRSDRINKTTVKFKFSIKVTNEGEIAGYAKEIIDYIPEGLKFVAEDNPKWRLTDDGMVLTDQLKDVLIEPGESQTVEIILTWINGKNNMGLKTNWAEIYEDDNDDDSPDIDSTPGNDQKDEDDEDDAPVIISTATGNMPKYFVLALATTSIIVGGIILIKKYVIE